MVDGPRIRDDVPETKLPKHCVFCGKPPVEKNREHVIPRWLIEHTGDPNRKARFGFNLPSDSPGEIREYAFAQFTFPACADCNLSFSGLEAHAKNALLKVLSGEELVSTELSYLLDWFDKVRVGLWLGFRQLNRDFMYVRPQFHIASRVGQFDRMLAVRRSDATFRRLTFVGPDSPAFAYAPSVFTLIVNDYYFMNISSFLLLARRLGFPYPDAPFYAADTMRLGCNLVPGRERIMRPVLKRPLPRGSIAIYQPMFRGGLSGGRQAIYDTSFVRQHSTDFDVGAGAIFYEGASGAVDVIGSDHSIVLRPPDIETDDDLMLQAATDTFEFQNWVNDFPVSMRLLNKEQKSFIKGRMSMARRFNNMVVEQCRKRMKDRLSGSK